MTKLDNCSLVNLIKFINQTMIICGTNFCNWNEAEFILFQEIQDFPSKSQLYVLTCVPVQTNVCKLYTGTH